MYIPFKAAVSILKGTEYKGPDSKTSQWAGPKAWSRMRREIIVGFKKAVVHGFWLCNKQMCWIQGRGMGSVGCSDGSDNN